MRILHLITALGVGGAEKHLLMLSAGQVQRGHVAQVAYFKGAGELTTAFEGRGVAVTALPGPSLRLRGQLAGLLSDFRPDVLHTHLLKADALGALASIGGKAGVVISSKHNDERALLRWPVSLAHGLLARRVARTIAL